LYVRTPKEIGALIRDRRKRLALDQSTLAKRAGVSRQWIIEAEHGKPRAAVGLILRTLDALGVKLAVDGQKPDRGNFPAPPDIDEIVQNARKRRR
jgi:HTH-type transcriptional regulator/antitoxin HipB